MACPRFGFERQEGAGCKDVTYVDDPDIKFGIDLRGLAAWDGLGPVNAWPARRAMAAGRTA